MAINKLSKYHVILEDLRNRITQGTLKEEDILPSENQLSAEYETSRVTARKALAVLAGEGFIFAVQGKGNFVSKAKTDEFILTFTDGNEAERKLIGAQIVKPTEQLIGMMQLSKADKILETKSFFMKETKTIGYSIKHIPYDPKRPVMEKELHYINLPESEEPQMRKSSVISVCNADESIAAVLKLPLGYPMMHMQIKTLDSGHRTVGLEEIYMMGDQYRIVGE
ncbi:MAG: GntR family transcriptional regulator [Anaerofustis sp.]